MKENSGQFKKGQTSWNKGKKGVLKPNKTSFKKGVSPWNKNKKGVQISTRKGLKTKPLTEETKRKISEANKGKTKTPCTEEHRKKLSISHMGQIAWNKGMGNQKETVRIRRSKEIVLWKKACLQRDNFTDAKTGIRGGNLAVHHINNFSSFPELRTSLENGITLSRESHNEFHKIYGKRNNTREQLMEFLNTK